MSTVHFDDNGHPKFKSVHYDVEELAKKHIRDWTDKMGHKTDWIVVCDNPNDKSNFILLAMSRAAYLKVMQEIGAIKVV